MSRPNLTLGLAPRLRHPAVRLVLLTALLAGVQSAFAVLSARWLGPSDRGIFAIGVGISTFSLLIGSLGVYTGGRVLLSDPGSGFTWFHYRRVIGILTAIQAVIIVAVDIPAWHALTSVSDGPTFAAFAAYCLSMTAASLAREGVHGVGKHLRATTTDLSAAMVQIGLSIALNSTHRVTVPNLLLCGAAGFCVQLALCARAVRTRRSPHTRLTRRTRPPSDPTGTAKQIRRVIAFSTPGLVLVTGQVFIQKGDRLVLGIFTGPRDVGIYAAGATIADAAWIIPTSVSVIVLRQVAASHSLRPLEKWRPAILLTTAASALLLALGGSALIHFLLGDQYAEATRIVWILSAGSLLFASQQVDIAACSGAGRLDVGARVTAWGVVALLVFSFALMPAFGGTGAAVASILAYGWMAVLARRACAGLEIRPG